MSSPALSIGAYGEDVLQLQASLLQAGYHVPAREAARGFFGPATRQAVRRCQAQNQLPVTGVVEAQTAAALTAPATGADVHHLSSALTPPGELARARALTAEGGPGPGPPAGVSSPGAGTPVPSAAPAALAERLCCEADGTRAARLGKRRRRARGARGASNSADGSEHGPVPGGRGAGTVCGDWTAGQAPAATTAGDRDRVFAGAARAGDRRAAWRAASGGGDRVCRVRHRRNRGRGRGVR